MSVDWEVSVPSRSQKRSSLPFFLPEKRLQVATIILLRTVQFPFRFAFVIIPQNATAAGIIIIMQSHRLPFHESAASAATLGLDQSNGVAEKPSSHQSEGATMPDDREQRSAPSAPTAGLKNLSVTPAPVSSRCDIFPFRLHQMLDDAAPMGFQEVVSWLPHGKAFRVWQKEVFALDICTCKIHVCVC